MNSLPLKQLQEKVALERNEQAYKVLFRYFYKGLTSTAISLVRTKEEAEEVVSDVMMKIWALDERLNHIDNLTVYLYRMTKNTAISHLRKFKSMRSFDDIEDLQLHEQWTPETWLLNQEWSKKVRMAIQSLPPKCQLAYKLVRENGFSYKEAATILKISENTVDRHLNNALHKLTETLKTYLHQSAA